MYLKQMPRALIQIACTCVPAVSLMVYMYGIYASVDHDVHVLARQQLIGVLDKSERHEGRTISSTTALSCLRK